MGATNMSVMARSWPWLEPFYVRISVKMFKLLPPHAAAAGPVCPEAGGYYVPFLGWGVCRKGSNLQKPFNLLVSVKKCSSYTSVLGAVLLWVGVP